jgi:glycosyltransferase involved in cell wall biosynthesis
MLSQYIPHSVNATENKGPTKFRRVSLTNEIAIDQRLCRIDILLATFQGAKYIEQQIDSVLSAMTPGSRLLIRDDGSDDRTPDILKRYAKANKNIVLIEDSIGRLGVRSNFSRLLQLSDADYITFCDQDDVWLPGRISTPLDRVLKLEKKFGKDRPILVHTDLVVVDKDLQVISPSLWNFCRLNPRNNKSLNRLLVQNVVTGCASIINRSLANLAQPFPSQCAMHDWWLGLVAAAFGHSEYVKEPSVLYRQHSNNTVGVVQRNIFHSIIDVLVFGKNPTSDILCYEDRQAMAFMQRFNRLLNPKQKSLLDAFTHLKNSSYIKRREIILRNGFFISGWLRNLGWMALL